MEIFFESEADISGELQKVIEDTVIETASACGAREGEVSVTVTDDAGIQEINREYRGLDASTDCLSFPQYERAGAAEGYVMLGDVVISLETARRQAEEYGHSIERELAFLAAHSTLHLCGYDHETEADEREMFARQEGILDKLGFRR
ncbi:MAG: rRNA maturation RNase YbeY [Clostridiales bacterium]|jgi:probable rRNA maturation factor|nr:rRNA maturation RNase YbeY [Clostridiales bacterium]